MHDTSTGLPNGMPTSGTSLRSVTRAAELLPLDTGTARWMDEVHLQLRDGVNLAREENGTWTLRKNEKRLRFRLSNSQTETVFLQLARSGCTLLELLATPGARDGALSAFSQLHRLWYAGLLIQTLRVEGVTIAELQARGETPLVPPVIGLLDPVTLTENVCIRRDGSALVVESLEYGALLRIESSDYFSIVPELMGRIDPHGLAQRLGGKPDLAVALVSWLLGIAAVRRLSLECDRDESAASRWSFADRLFHSRSRLDRHIGGYGNTAPLRGVIDQPPSVRTPRNAPTISLPPLLVDDIVARDAPFTSVLEMRRSVRQHGDEPISLAQLGEFLYRCARIKARFQQVGSNFIARPFPSGGCLHELEFYPLVNRCRGLASGLYRYEGAAHVLEPVSSRNQHVRKLLTDAMQSCGLTREPHVLIILAARFLRVNWKYESIAYSLILKNVGIAYQTMYLVATAMNLAPCAVGGGSSTTFCKAAGTAYWEEGSVGEFLLGLPEKRSLQRA